MAYLAGGIEHGDEAPDLQKVLAQLALDLEGGFGDIEYLGQVILTVPFLRRHRAGEIRSGLEPFEGGFEHGDDHPHALDVVQRFFFSGTVHDLAFHFHFVADRYDFHCFYLHVILLKNLRFRMLR